MDTEMKWLDPENPAVSQIPDAVMIITTKLCSKKTEKSMYVQVQNQLLNYKGSQI